MSLITRCPACATQFKVVPDQLKLSDGWVRCGHCSDVFDATRYLQSWSPGNSPSKSSGVQQVPPPSSRERPAQPLVKAAVPSSATQAAGPTSEAAGESAPAPIPEAACATLHANDIDQDLVFSAPDLPLDTKPSRPRDVSPSAAAPRAQAAVEPVDRDTANASDFHAELQRFAAGQGKPSEAGPVAFPVGPAVSSPAGVSPSVVAKAVQPREVEVAQPPDSQAGVAVALEPNFMRQARQRAFWRSPTVRVLLTLVALLLSVVLTAQWAVQERDRLAARHPHLQPLLASLCEPLGCTIGAVRDLRAVVIDSATLTRKRGDFYAFDLVLKNTADTPLAVPALELSLTDTADTVISRRVFLPQELSGVPPLLPPQSTVPVSLRLSLVVGNELPMAGYRALVFYP